MVHKIVCDKVSGEPRYTCKTCHKSLVRQYWQSTAAWMAAIAEFKAEHGGDRK